MYHILFYVVFIVCSMYLILFFIYFVLYMTYHVILFCITLYCVLYVLYIYIYMLFQHAITEGLAPSSPLPQARPAPARARPPLGRHLGRVRRVPR